MQATIACLYPIIRYNVVPLSLDRKYWMEYDHLWNYVQQASRLSCIYYMLLLLVDDTKYEVNFFHN